MQRRDRGQATPLVAVVVVLAALALVGLGLLGRSTADAARARTAADAAALAGVVDGEAGARRLAVANGGVVTRFARAGDDVVVTVVVGTARATARATLSLDG